jgi:hypothetical protein
VSASQYVRTRMIDLRRLHTIVSTMPMALWPEPSKWRVQAYYPSFIAGTVVLRRIRAQYPAANTSPFRVLRAVSGQLRWIVSQCWPHIAVVLLFIGFAIQNQGIVLRDKSNHQATLHGARVLNVFAVTMVFTGGIPAMLRALVPRTATQTRCQVTFNVAVAVVVHFLRHTHPFLLADNRHHTFHIWRKLLLLLLLLLRYSLAKYLPATPSQFYV